MEQIILGIDIGSSKICSLIAEIKGGVPQIIGMGIRPAQGVKKGTITNIEQASKSIRESVSDAKRIAGVNVSQAVISISGAYTKSIDSQAITSNSGSNKEIGIQEIRRAMHTALYNAEIPNNYEMLHTLPYSFKVDSSDYVDNPFGINGNRLDVSTHIITAQKNGLENLKKAVRNAGIEVTDVVLNAYASSIAVLTNDEKELGVACIDMGASSCDIMIHCGNAMRYNYFLGVGSAHITKDIVAVLNLNIATAEELKRKHITLYDLTPEDIYSVLEIPSENKNIPLETLHGVVTSRVSETLMLIEEVIEHSGLRNNLGAGIVITGGMSNMKGLSEMALNIFKGLPVRIASPKDINGSFDVLDPSYSTAIGLILYGSGKYTNYELDANKKLKYNQEKGIDNAKLSNLKEDNDLSDLKNISTTNEENVQQEKIDIKLKKNTIKEKAIEWIKNIF